MWLWVLNRPGPNPRKINPGADQQGHMLESMQFHTHFHKAYIIHVAVGPQILTQSFQIRYKILSTSFQNRFKILPKSCFRNKKKTIGLVQGRFRSKEGDWANTGVASVVSKSIGPIQESRP